MPYIYEDDRDLYAPSAVDASSPGALNFQITHLIHSYVRYNGLSYGNLNDVMGALESAKLEFYRRVVAPYEDGKIEENGDLDI